MDKDACQDAFVTGLVALMQQQHQILLPLLSCYAARLSSDYLADHLLRLLPDHASRLGSFSALLSLLFRHCAPSDEAVQLVRAQLDVFGQKSGDRYTRHAWQLYRIGITASQGAWYAIVAEIMHGLQPLVTSEAFAMWLSVLEEFAIAEQNVTLQQVDERKHVRLLTKLKGIQTLISVSSIQTGFVSLRMQWLYAVKHLATMLASFRQQQHAASGFKISKMLIDHASRLRHLAHQYDLAIVKMKHMDADMKAQLIVYKLSALLLTFLCQVIAKASYDDPSFFPMRPMLLQTMVTDWRDGQQPFQQLCIHLMQQAEQWDDTRPVEEMVDAMQTFCSRALCLPCPLPFSFFKMKRATAPPQSHVAAV
ncbi:hypothetical protein BC940DRAFT_43027 [Gongronella butleri]|nr:hypothetical protein BC940DRAFT_43027 [Gongronella butleri]